MANSFRHLECPFRVFGIHTEGKECRVIWLNFTMPPNDLDFLRQNRKNRTKNDWATERGNLLQSRYQDVEKVRLVCDNLNTHTPGAFDEVYPATEARALIKRIEFHYTPKHGSWLNIAENELSVMTRQCLEGRRIGEIEILREETNAWAENTNKQQKGVDWQFKVDDARIKLKRLYPQIIL